MALKKVLFKVLALFFNWAKKKLEEIEIREAGEKKGEKKD